MRERLSIPMRLAFIGIFFFVIAAAAGCSSAFTSMQSRPIMVDTTVALYSIEEGDYPSASDLRAELKAPADMPNLGPEKIQALFGNLRYYRRTLFGTTERNVFDQEEMHWLVPAVSKALPKIGKNRLVIISRHDPDRSVLSRMERSTVVMWADADGINLIFGEIKQEIPHNDFLEEDRWTDILPVSARRSFPDLILKDAPFFKKKVIVGNEHNTWAVVPLADLENLKYVPPAEKSADGKKTEVPAEPVKVKRLSERLSDLKKAREENLISEEEYQTLRKKAIDAP